MTAAGVTILASESEGFHPPGPADFELPSIFDIGDLAVTKPMLLVIISGILIFVFTYAASRKAAVVPGKLQYVGEAVYGFVRNGIARDSIGSEHFMKFVPYLFSLFLFVVVNNYFGVVPFLQFPSFSRSGFVYGLAGLTWIIYNGVGIWKHGFAGYIKHQVLPPGVKGPILALIIPLEFMSNILVRPVTLALRLFANMFAGHLLVILFTLGGEYLLLESKTAYIPVGVISLVLAVAISFLEMLIMFLQAYVFTLLTAMYIGGAVNEEH